MKRYLDPSPPKSTSTTSPRRAKRQDSSPLAFQDDTLPPLTRPYRDSSYTDSFAAGGSTPPILPPPHGYPTGPSRPSSTSSRSHFRSGTLIGGHADSRVYEPETPSLLLVRPESRADRRRRLRPSPLQEIFPDPTPPSLRRMCQICDAMVDMDELNSHLLEHSGELPSRLGKGPASKRCQSCTSDDIRPSALDDSILLCSTCGAVQDSVHQIAVNGTESASSRVGQRDNLDTLSSLMDRLSLPPADAEVPSSTRRSLRRSGKSSLLELIPGQDLLEGGFDNSGSLLGDLPPLPPLQRMPSSLQSRSAGRSLQRQVSLSGGSLSSSPRLQRPSRDSLADLQESGDGTPGQPSRWSRRR
ncbi:hypothetical protein P389DRAFT_209798 [Cystobasidium minutum MCA 4210]|uniref:uncharacterized protein n=1 Tax=Cystobasidium minutum MCA 4210 TaxID=1397322 RepID=UPI0034CD0D27|eukprot:jgi/Rhomi1/209798/estExt_Genemark1.C_3_t10450